MKRMIALASLAAVLSGCGVRILPRPAPVLVPVTTPCVTGELPAEPAKVSGQLTGDSGLDLGIIAGSAIELRAWGVALRNILNACRAPRSSL